MALTKTPVCDFGKKAEDFKLKSIENKLISLNDVKGEKATLIMFICNHCPYVKAIIREGSNIQDGSVIHTDPGCPTIVGKGVTVGHMVMLHGCEISDDCIIGIGSTILNKAKIGKNCIIGANSLVTENKVIPDRSLVLGSPGKVVRQVTDEEIEHIKENARDYVENIKKYKK